MLKNSFEKSKSVEMKKKDANLFHVKFAILDWARHFNRARLATRNSDNELGAILDTGCGVDLFLVVVFDFCLTTNDVVIWPADDASG